MSIQDEVGCAYQTALNFVRKHQVAIRERATHGAIDGATFRAALCACAVDLWRTEHA